MATASGSIAYLGAARFQGFWSASTNNATGSGLPAGKWNTIADAAMKGLFSTGSQNNSGYDGDHAVSASAGDYWQVTGSGTHNVEDTIQWSLNDWCIYSGSSGGTGTWIKLAFADTIASIIVGDLSSSSFHMGVANDKHVIFDSGSVHSGSKNFTFDYDNNNLLLTGTFTLDGNALLGDGDSDVTTVASQLTASAGLLVNEKAIINNDFEAKSKVTLGDAATDVATVTGQLTASQGIYATKRSIFASDVEIGGALHGGSPLVISGSVLMGTGCTDSIGLSGSLTASCDSVIKDDTKIYFGTDHDAYIEFDETHLIISGASPAGTKVSGSIVLGNAGSDVTTVASRLTASEGITANKKSIFLTDVILGANAAYRTTVLGQLTASEGILAGKKSVFSASILVADDTKVYFGTDHDAYIEFDDSYLIISGASPLGTKVSGNLILGNDSSDIVTATSRLTASEGILASKKSTFSSSILVTDNNKLHFGTDHDASIHYDEANINKLILSGAAFISMPDNTGAAFAIFEGANQYINIITSNSNEAVVISQDAWMTDDKKFYFGTSKNAYIEYDSSYLIISGASPLGTKVSGNIILGGASDQTTVAGPLLLSGDITAGTGASPIDVAIAGNLSCSANVTVGGDLLVNGSTVTQDVVNSIIQDPIIGLGYGVTGSADASTGSAGDRGLVMGLTGSNAVAMIWDNSATQFAFVTTANNPAAIEITPATYEDLRVSAIDIGGSAILDADGVTKVQHDVTGTLGGLKHAAGKLSVDIKNLPSGSDNMIATDLMVFQDGHASGSTRVLPISKLLNLITASGDAAVTAVNNKTESRLVTIGSTTSELDGEANLTYDGTTFVVNDDARVNDDLPLYFGSHSDAYIKYRETGDNLLVISGSKGTTGGLVLSGSKLFMDIGTVASGTLAGQGSYLGVTATGQVVLGAPTGSGGGGGSVAADDIGTGDAAIALAGGSGHSITINATAAQAQLKTTTSGEVDITSAGAIDINAAATLTVDAVGTSNVTTNGALTVSGSTGLVLASDGGEIDITARLGLIDINASAGAIDIDAGTTIDIDAAGGINLGKASDVAFDVDTSTLDIDSSGAITIDGTSTFSVDAVGTSNVTTNGALTLSGSTGLVLASDGGEIDITARLGLIDINASAGAIDIDAAGAVTIDSSGGVISVGNDNIDQNVNIATGGSRTLNIGILDGTDTTTWTTKGNISHSGTFTIGGASTGFDAKLFGATTGKYLLWDESGDELVLAASSKLSFHDAAGGENIVASSDGHLEINAGTTLDITATTVDVNGYLDVDGKVTIDPASDVGGAALTVTNTDTDQIAVDIDASNIDANVLDIAADAVTSANVIEITADALSTGKVLNIVSNSSETDDRDLVLIHQDHSSAVNATPLRIVQDAASCPALHVQGPTIGGQTSTASVNANGVTVTIAMLMTQTIAAAGRGSSKTDTSDTAANIVAAIPNVRVGDGIEFTYINMSSNTVAFAGGTGVINLSAGAASFNIASMNGRKFLFTIMNIGGGSESVVMSPITAAYTLTS